MPEYTAPTAGQDADAATTQSYATQSRRPGHRVGATVEIWEDAQGNQRMDYSAGRPTGSQSLPAPTASPVTFSRAGVPVLGRDVQMSDAVDLGGAIGETSVYGALHYGWLIEGPNGFVRAGEAAQAPQQDQQAPQQDRPSDPLAPEAPVRDHLPGNAEAILSHIEARNGDAYTAIQSVLISGKMPSDQDLDAAGAAMGIDREEVSRLVHGSVAEFSKQANQAVSEMIGDPEQLWAWCSSDKRGAKLFETARRLQATERSLEGYAALSRAYILDLAETEPETVAAGLVAGGTKASVEGGKVVIDLGGGMGTTSLGAAFNAGLAAFSGGRSKRRGGRK